jgi:hypothetical protein
LLTSDYAKPAIGKLESVGAQDISKQSSNIWSTASQTCPEKIAYADFAVKFPWLEDRHP